MWRHYVLHPAADLFAFDGYICHCFDQIHDKKQPVIITCFISTTKCLTRTKLLEERSISTNSLRVYEGRCLECLIHISVANQKAEALYQNKLNYYLYYPTPMTSCLPARFHFLKTLKPSKTMLLTKPNV